MPGARPPRRSLARSLGQDSAVSTVRRDRPRWMATAQGPPYLDLTGISESRRMKKGRRHSSRRILTRLDSTRDGESETDAANLRISLGIPAVDSVLRINRIPSSTHPKLLAGTLPPSYFSDSVKSGFVRISVKCSTRAKRLDAATPRGPAAAVRPGVAGGARAEIVGHNFPLWFVHSVVLSLVVTRSLDRSVLPGDAVL